MLFVILGADTGQNLWRFDYDLRKSPSWKQSTSPVSWTAPPAEQAKEMSNPTLPQPKVNGEIDHHLHQQQHHQHQHHQPVIGPDETLQSLLDRLSLSTHLNLFQVRISTCFLFSFGWSLVFFYTDFYASFIVTKITAGKMADVNFFFFFW